MNRTMPQMRKQSSADIDAIPSTLDDSTQDWICIKCNNLNFSFRKKCNRCKVQSREDNQQLLYADYYYYNHYYAYPGSQGEKEVGEVRGVEKGMEEMHSPRKNVCLSAGQLDVIESDHLPSVSPLVKKYRAGRGGVSAKRKSSVFLWKLFEEQCWSGQQLPIVIVPCLSKDLSLTDDQQPSEQFAKSVQRMIV